MHGESVLSPILEHRTISPVGDQFMGELCNSRDPDCSESST